MTNKEENSKSKSIYKKLSSGDTYAGEIADGLGVLFFFILYTAPTSFQCSLQYIFNQRHIFRKKNQFGVDGI